MALGMKRRPSCRFLKYLLGFGFIAVWLTALAIYNREMEHHDSLADIKRVHWDIQREIYDIGFKEYPIIKSFERKDWHDYEFMKYEASRKGPGEQAEDVILVDPEEIELDRKLEREDGLHVFVSDKISVNRSVRDTRPKLCATKKYLKDLPRTSVIVIFYDEWPSILKRTLHSIYNRTPRELLHELIVVNDNSSKPELGEPFERYLKDNFDDRVKFLWSRKRQGLIVARMAGATLATGEVLVFLDSHMEVNVNWLPPLLEEIVISPTTITTPVIVWPNFSTFAFGASYHSSRGIYDDMMWYKWFPMRKKDRVRDYLPYQEPIMLGCAFAVRRDYFYDLGQTDEGLQIWNGEQIELSLKLHLCGGNLLEVPCSHISHLFRTNQKRHKVEGIDVAARNFKRVAEVWMDDYKKVMYEADPERLGAIDPGDLTKAKLVKEKLKCKPFQYFLEKIAPEMYTRYYYQLHYPGYFAVGAIGSNAVPGFCIDTMGKNDEGIKLFECRDKTLMWPNNEQFFKLTWHRKLRLYFNDDCLQDDLKVSFCHYSEGYELQEWKFNMATDQITSLSKKGKCLTVASDNVTIELQKCNATELRQKWTWGKINETMLNKFDKISYKDGVGFIGFENDKEL